MVRARAEWVTLEDAAGLVADGSTIAFGGMTVYRRPVAFVKALLRRPQRPQGLTLLCFTAGYECDLLVGAGCVSTVRSAYFGLEAFGFAPMFTEWANAGRLRVMEETEASFAAGMRAAMAGIGFMPARAWIGTDLPALRPDVKQIVDPYTGETLMAFPAMPCDVAVLHALEADRFGAFKINNNTGVDLELVATAKTVIVTAERMVDQVERDADGLLIPEPGATVLALAPRGAYPTSCYPDYPIGGGELMRYVDACAAGGFEAYLEAALAAEG